ncbi:S1 RNA-binding domain-containing protein [Patescibacteria group bacterium]|nr:S1 RNA-binding domain-containing protein [Patescibacteria group bacterium]
MTLTKKAKTDQVQKSDAAMEHLLLQGEAKPIPKIGELIEGMIINISKNEIQLDIDGLTTGVVRGKEIYDESGEYSNIKTGDKVTATVVELENEQGQMELSFRYAGHQKAWQRLEDLEKSGEIVEAKVIDANKGGLMLKVGNVIGFMPVSQLTTEHYPRVEGGDKSRILQALKKFVNKNFRVKVIDVHETEEKLIVSEKSAWEEKQSKALSNFKVGDIIEGEVTGVVDFGAFVEFGDNLEGLVHISELAWQRIDSPRQIIKVGDKIKAVIIAIEDSKISLSLKQLVNDPWKEVGKKYKVGQRIKGKVLKINPFGAFVELDKDIHGLLHISEIANKQINEPAEAVKEGQEYEFTIISLEPQDHRLGLSLKK